MPKKKADTPANVTGFRVKPRYREVVCDWFELDGGEEPFKATIRTNLTFGELRDIPSGKDVTFEDVWQAIYPYVTGWNLVGETEDGTTAPVPPPAEEGPDAFFMLDAGLNLWLIGQVRTAHLGGPKALERDGASDRKNGSAPFGSTPAPDGDKN